MALFSVLAQLIFRNGQVRERLAGSVGGTWDSISGHEFELHVGCRDYLNKLIFKTPKTKKLKKKRNVQVGACGWLSQ